MVDYTTPLATSNTGTMSKKDLKAYLVRLPAPPPPSPSNPQLTPPLVLPPPNQHPNPNRPPLKKETQPR